MITFSTVGCEGKGTICGVRGEGGEVVVGYARIGCYIDSISVGDGISGSGIVDAAPTNTCTVSCNIANGYIRRLAARRRIVYYNVVDINPIGGAARSGGLNHDGHMLRSRI